MTLDNLALLSGFALEAVLVFLLLRRRIWCVLPLFTVYIAWSLSCDAANAVVVHWYPLMYPHIYVFEAIVDSILIFAVQVELLHTILEPETTRISRGLTVLLVVLMAFAALVFWPFANHLLRMDVAPQARFFLNLQCTLSFLRIACFVAMTFSGRPFSIRGGNVAMQAAAGLGFFSLVSLVVTALHSYLSWDSFSYSFLDRVVSISYLAVLVYWVLCISRNAPAGRKGPKGVSSLT